MCKGCRREDSEIDWTGTMKGDLSLYLNEATKTETLKGVGEVEPSCEDF